MKRIIPRTYKEYNQLVVKGENFNKDNITINIHGAIDVNNRSLTKKYLYNALSFTTDKLASDEILKAIKGIKVDEEFMNSRCYPTGLFNIGNVMIVGMNPGRKGRSVEGYPLKPSFVYQSPSFNLRKACEYTFGNDIPYVTNLCKYATVDNKVSEKQYEEYEFIFHMEINYMKPRLIIALGNDVYNYIDKYILTEIPVIKIMHPAGICYNDMTVKDYVIHFRNKVRQS